MFISNLVLCLLAVSSFTQTLAAEVIDGHSTIENNERIVTEWQTSSKKIAFPEVLRAMVDFHCQKNSASTSNGVGAGWLTDICEVLGSQVNKRDEVWTGQEKSIVEARTLTVFVEEGSSSIEAASKASDRRVSQITPMARLEIRQEDCSQISADASRSASQAIQQATQQAQQSIDAASRSASQASQQASQSVSQAFADASRSVSQVSQSASFAVSSAQSAMFQAQESMSAAFQSASLAQAAASSAIAIAKGSAGAAASSFILAADAAKQSAAASISIVGAQASAQVAASQTAAITATQAAVAIVGSVIASSIISILAFWCITKRRKLVAAAKRDNNRYGGENGRNSMEKRPVAGDGGYYSEKTKQDSSNSQARSPSKRETAGQSVLPINKAEVQREAVAAMRSNSLRNTTTSQKGPSLGSWIVAQDEISPFRVFTPSPKDRPEESVIRKPVNVPELVKVPEPVKISEPVIKQPLPTRVEARNVPRFQPGFRPSPKPSFPVSRTASVTQPTLASRDTSSSVETSNFDSLQSSSKPLLTNGSDNTQWTDDRSGLQSAASVQPSSKIENKVVYVNAGQDSAPFKRNSTLGRKDRRESRFRVPSSVPLRNTADWLRDRAAALDETESARTSVAQDERVSRMQSLGMGRAR